MQARNCAWARPSLPEEKKKQRGRGRGRVRCCPCHSLHSRSQCARVRTRPLFSRASPPKAPPMQPAAAPTGRGANPGCRRSSLSGGARPSALAPAPDSFARRASIDGGAASRRASLSGLARPAHLTACEAGRGGGEGGSTTAPRATATDTPAASPSSPVSNAQDVPIPDKANPARKPRILIAGGGIGGERIRERERERAKERARQKENRRALVGGNCAAAPHCGHPAGRLRGPGPGTDPPRGQSVHCSTR